MEILNKLLGSRGCQIVVGASATPVKTGFVAYGCTVRVADTQIKSITQSGVAATDHSFESIALIVSEYISFEVPITSITLNAAADSVTLWLQPVKE